MSSSCWWSPNVVPYRYTLMTGFALTSAFFLLYLHFVTLEIGTDIADVTNLWKTLPIVSIYAPTENQGYDCSTGYEALSLSFNSITAVMEGSCGCSENAFGYVSTNAPCSSASESSNVCLSLPPLSATPSTSWRESTICVKRGGPQRLGTRPPTSTPTAAALTPTTKASVHRASGSAALAPPSSKGCFPSDTECPITNIMVYPTGATPPANQGWQSVGVYTSSNLTMFVRREYFGELPVVALLPQLTEVSSTGDQLRGQCYQGPNQGFDGPLKYDTSSLWTYTAALPAPCKSTDPRYLLVDSVTLENHFLQNVQVSKPSCSNYHLYSLTDPRYNASADPDYLHSGVPCGTAPLYSACARDPFQHTDCAAGDSICDGVVHQNICGEYARAVRSAFGGSDVQLGLYLAREVQWTDACDVSKESVFAYRRDVETVARYCLISFLYILGQLLKILPVADLYNAVKQGDCTDGFTTETLLSRLKPSLFVLHFVILIMCFVGVIGLNYLVSYLTAPTGLPLATLQQAQVHVTTTQAPNTTPAPATAPSPAAAAAPSTAPSTTPSAVHAPPFRTVVVTSGTSRNQYSTVSVNVV